MNDNADSKQNDVAGPVTPKGASGDRLSRRRFTGAGLAVPAILTLANRPAFGAVCSPSGFVSNSPENPSGVRHEVSGCGGNSPGGWKKPDVGNGNSDGNRSQWYAAGYNPNPRDGTPGENDPAGTLFDVAFGTANDWGTMHDVLLTHSGSLEFHAVAALLNAAYFKSIATGPSSYMDPYDVVGLYNATVAGSSYQTVSGTTVTFTVDQLKAFFNQTYHTPDIE